MKGISDIIAMLLMLVITIAVAGLAYGFISGALTSTAQGISLVDSWCNTTGHVRIKLRNMGTTAIGANTISVIQTAPIGDTANPPSCCGNPIEPGQISAQDYIEQCTGSGSRMCIYRMTPPNGRTIEVAVNCA